MALIRGCLRTDRRGGYGGSPVSSNFGLEVEMQGVARGVSDGERAIYETIKYKYLCSVPINTHGK